MVYRKTATRAHHRGRPSRRAGHLAPKTVAPPRAKRPPRAEPARRRGLTTAEAARLVARSPPRSALRAPAARRSSMRQNADSRPSTTPPNTASRSSGPTQNPAKDRPTYRHDLLQPRRTRRLPGISAFSATQPPRAEGHTRPRSNHSRCSPARIGGSTPIAARPRPRRTRQRPRSPHTLRSPEPQNPGSTPPKKIGRGCSHRPLDCSSDVHTTDALDLTCCAARSATTKLTTWRVLRLLPRAGPMRNCSPAGPRDSDRRHRNPQESGRLARTARIGVFDG